MSYQEMQGVAAAMKLAIVWHEKQTDKQGKPYIGHLLRVAARVAHSFDAMTVALLHDIIEDTPLGESDLLTHGFPAHIVDAVVLLTKQPGLTYMDTIKKIATDPLATKVKLADLADNMDPARALPDEVGGPWMRERYQKAFDFLTKATQ